VFFLLVSFDFVAVVIGFVVLVVLFVIFVPNANALCITMLMWTIFLNIMQIDSIGS
jgi:hypothetical protein